MIITLDGPAGAGKSSAAKALAKRLGFEFLDTGAMYRAVTLAVVRAGLDPRQEATLAAFAENLRIDMPEDRVLLNGEDVTRAIRASEITQASGAVADSPSVRRHLVRLQQAIAQGRDMVCEGRDQGTVAFPDAFCKFFLVADPRERARRRQQDLAARGELQSIDEVLRAQEQRDERDANRELGAMVPAPDALIVDTTGLSLSQVVDRLQREVCSRQGRSA